MSSPGRMDNSGSQPMTMANFGVSQTWLQPPGLFQIYRRQ